MRLLAAAWRVVVQRGPRTAEERRAIYLVIATIPGGIGGLLLSNYAESAFRSPVLIAGTLIVMGLLLWVVDRLAPHTRPLESLRWTDALLIGIAKGPERKPGLEDIVFPNREHVLNLPPDHPGLHLLQQIRDEAHRFAIQGHRARRAKARNTSSLQEINGIGAKRRQALLAHFGGLKGMQSASVEDLARVPGISHALAERIYAQLH